MLKSSAELVCALHHRAGAEGTNKKIKDFLFWINPAQL
jgi:hypothetical protein